MAYSTFTQTAIETALDAETSQLLIDSLSQNQEVVSLRLIKARTNLAKARRDQPVNNAKLLEIEDRLLSVEYNVSDKRKSHENNKKNNETPSGAKKTKAEPVSVIDELNLLYSDLNPNHNGVQSTNNRNERGEVRQRLNKLEVNSYEQDNLSSEIVEMAAAIKRNALIFQKKLESDNDLVGTTTDAIQKTAGTMSNVGTRLQKYRKETQLGWMFYIMSVVFILASLFIGMALIQLFGKW